ncbi:unannotated protein [freshwater metagenome]|uniref:Unannotated protein n=1 Tax=freshwater metagenome TaxID=449393 RepID=A0A6J6QMB4_9ZZZZ
MRGSAVNTSAMASASAIETGSVSSTVMSPSPNALPGSKPTSSITSDPVATKGASTEATPGSYSTTNRETSPSMPLVGLTSTASVGALKPTAFCAFKTT